MRPLYVVDLVLPNGVTVTDVEVCGSEIAREGIDVLVGMNVIILGDFATSCKDGVTRFAFRVPSIEDADYVGIISDE